MSWTASLHRDPDGPPRAIPAHEFSRDALSFSPPYDDCSQEAKQQIDEAVVLVQQLLDCGAVGGGDKTFYVSLYGHANPAHEPSEGWADDAVTITVAQYSPRG